MMVVKPRTLLFSSMLLLLACAKDYSYERRVAKGFLVKESGICKPVQLIGNYGPNTTFTKDHYVLVQIHFTKAGEYDIRSDLQNGFSFRDSAIIKDTGVFNIKLKAMGSPLAAITTSFTVAFDSSYCSFSLPVLNGTLAQYSLVGTPASCTNAVLQGGYTKGIGLSEANKVSLEVNVTTIGRYAISAGPVNGMAFSAEGNFTNTGLQTILLQATGTPTFAGNNTIPVKAGSTDCSFMVNVAGNIDPALLNQSDSAWQFEQGDRTYKGFLDGVTTHMLHDTTVLTLVGLTPDYGFAIAIVVYFPGSTTVKTGSYAAPGAASFLFFDRAGNTIFSSGTVATNNQGTTVVISDYDPATRLIAGNFSGFALNSQNQRVAIASGKFMARVD